MTEDLKAFYKVIEDINIAMMTTRRPDGHLASRPMANQKQASGADLWFVSAEGTEKVTDLEQDPHLNLSYFRPNTMEWISVSGIATLSRAKEKIKELWAEDWKVWFPKEGDATHGTPDDPRLVLIGVKIHDACFLEVNQSKPVILYEMAKGWLTGTKPQIGEMHQLEEPRRPK